MCRAGGWCRFSIQYFSSAFCHSVYQTRSLPSFVRYIIIPLYRALLISSHNFWNLGNHFLCSLYFKSLQGRFVALYKSFSLVWNVSKNKMQSQNVPFTGWLYTFIWFLSFWRQTYHHILPETCSEKLEILLLHFCESYDNIPMTETHLCFIK